MHVKWDSTQQNKFEQIKNGERVWGVGAAVWGGGGEGGGSRTYSKQCNWIRPTDQRADRQKEIKMDTRPYRPVTSALRLEVVKTPQQVRTQYMHLWSSLCALNLLARQVRVTVGDSGLCCCVCLMSFKIRDSRLLYYLITEMKRWLNINYITVRNNTYCIF